MAIPTRPTQDGIIDPVWGQWVHDYLARAQYQSPAANHHFSTSNEVQNTPAPEVVGPCLFIFQCNIVTMNGQFVVTQLFVNGVAKATTTAQSASPSTGMSGIPVALSVLVPKAGVVNIRQTMGGAAIAADANYFQYLIIPVSDSTMTIATVGAELRPGDTADEPNPLEGAT